jgi:hypothetical protein
MRLVFTDEGMLPRHFTAQAATKSWILLVNDSPHPRQFRIVGNGWTSQLNTPLPPHEQVNFQVTLPAGTYIISEPSEVSKNSFVGDIVVGAPSASP